MVIFGHLNVTKVENQCSVVGFASLMWRLRYGMDGSECESRYGQEIFLFSKTFNSSLVFNGNRGFFPGVKRPGREANHLSPSTVFDGVERETFIFWIPRCKSTPCREETCYVALIIMSFFKMWSESPFPGRLGICTGSRPRGGRRDFCQRMKILPTSKSYSPALGTSLLLFSGYREFVPLG